MNLPAKLILLSLIPLYLLSCGKDMAEEEYRQQILQHQENEEMEQARDLLEEQVEKYPEGKHTEEALRKLAFLYYNTFQEYDRAIEIHKRILSDFPESPNSGQSQFMVGYIYANNVGDYDSARKAYEAFLEKYPASELAESVRWEIEHLGKDVNTQLKDLFKEGNGTSGALAQ